MISYEGMFEAFDVCIKRKRNTNNALRFEINLESNIIALVDAINNRSYEPSRSIAFVVSRPKYREVFAADFRDRVVHHWICLRLEPLMEQVFSSRTFNCRKGKGVDYGVRMLAADIKECSQDYTRDCYVATADMKGFFMSIPKTLLADLIDNYIIENYFGEDKDDLRWVTRKLILHNPERDCYFKSPIWKWRMLPKAKTLRYGNGENGIPIGNLISQIFANFFLNDFDWYLESNLHFKHHGRYVDDFYIVDTSKQKILKAMPEIRRKLSEVGVKLHPNKFYIQHYTKGARFTGSVIKKDRVYILNRTVEGLIHALKASSEVKSVEEAEQAMASVNSYLGFMCHKETYNIRRRCLGNLPVNFHRYFSIRPDLNAIALRKELSPYECVKTAVLTRDYKRILPLHLQEYKTLTMKKSVYITTHKLLSVAEESGVLVASWDNIGNQKFNLNSKSKW